MSLLDDLLGDLEAECDQLWQVVGIGGESGWATPTPAPGWTVATQIAHLAWTDEVAVVAATDKTRWDEIVLAAIDDPEGFVDAGAHEIARLPREEVLGRWFGSRSVLYRTLAEYPEGQKMPWFGPPMSPASMVTARFMETWAHALDVYEALGMDPEPTDRIRNVAHLGIRTRDFSFGVHELTPPAEEFRIELTAPSGELWIWGPDDAAQRVAGSAHEFCLLVTQRVHRDDTDLLAIGADAEKWLTIAQAFAGPPGKGREPK